MAGDCNHVRIQFALVVGVHQCGQRNLVSGPAQALGSFLDGAPLGPVHLSGVHWRHGRPGHHGRLGLGHLTRGPVVHALELALGGDVLQARKRNAQHDVLAGLFLDLADSGRGESLTEVNLALRPRPVVVLGPVDELDLQRTVVDAPHERARAFDDGCAFEGRATHAGDAACAPALNLLQWS